MKKSSRFLALLLIMCLLLADCGALDKFSPSYVEMLADENGRIYGLSRDGYVLGMHINVTLFREAGLMTEEGLPMYPTTLQELAEYGQIIREKTGKAGLVFPASETYGGWLFTNIAWNYGCVGENALEYQDENGRWVCNFTSSQAIAAMEYIRDLKWTYDILNADAMMRSVVFSMIPPILLFALFQKQLTENTVSAGIKG